MAVTVRIIRDGDAWIAEVPRAKGFSGSASSLSRLRRSLRKTIDEFYPELAGEELREVFDLPADTKRTLIEMKKAGEAARRAQAKALDVRRQGARKLQKKLGVSVRDLGTLMDVSSARAQQFLEEE